MRLLNRLKLRLYQGLSLMDFILLSPYLALLNPPQQTEVSC